jgi:hypothetical protein
MKIKNKEENNSTIGTIFFLPKKKGQIMVGKYCHCGIIYKNKLYETIEEGCGHYGHCVEKEDIFSPQFKKQKAVFLATKIYPEKIEQEINSGTSPSQFVLRVMGMSNLKGKETGSLQPSDVYKMIGRKKYDSHF